MLNFEEYLFEELLQEVLDSEFQINHNKDLKNWVNDQIKDKIYSGHTSVMSSDHMDKHNVAVLRFMNKKNEVEYHIVNLSGHQGRLNPAKQDRMVGMHTLKIIHDDSKHYLDKGNKIKFQTNDDKQHETYKKLSNRIIKGREDKQVKDLGKTKLTDGSGEGHTLMIESFGYSAINWGQMFIDHQTKD